MYGSGRKLLGSQSIMLGKGIEMNYQQEPDKMSGLFFFKDSIVAIFRFHLCSAFFFKIELIAATNRN